MKKLALAFIMMAAVAGGATTSFAFGMGGGGTQGGGGSHGGAGAGRGGMGGFRAAPGFSGGQRFGVVRPALARL